MPLELGERSATLSGVITIDEVEPLVAWLRRTSRASVRLRDCNHLHTGALQALLFFRPKVSAAPVDSFLATQVLPLLEGSSGTPGRREGKPP